MNFKDSPFHISCKTSGVKYKPLQIHLSAGDKKRIVREARARVMLRHAKAIERLADK